MSPELSDVLEQAKQDVKGGEQTGTQEQAGRGMFRIRMMQTPPEADISEEDQYFIRRMSESIANDIRQEKKEAPFIFEDGRLQYIGPEPEDVEGPEEQEDAPVFTPKPFAALGTKTNLPPLVDTAQRDIQKLIQGEEREIIPFTEEESALPEFKQTVAARQATTQRDLGTIQEQPEIETGIPEMETEAETAEAASTERPLGELPEEEGPEVTPFTGIEPGGPTDEHLRAIPPQSLPLQFARAFLGEVIPPWLPSLETIKENVRPFGTPKTIMEKAARGAGGLGGMFADFLIFGKGTNLVLKGFKKYNKFISSIDEVSPALSKLAHRGISNTITFNAHGQMFLPSGPSVEERIKSLENSSIMAAAFTGAGSLGLINKSAAKLEPYALFGIGAGIGDKQTPIEDRIINGALLVALHKTIQGATDQVRREAVRDAVEKHGYNRDTAEEIAAHIENYSETMAEVVETPKVRLYGQLRRVEPSTEKVGTTRLREIMRRIETQEGPVRGLKQRPSQEIMSQQIEKLQQLGYRNSDIVRMSQGERSMISATGTPNPVRIDAHRGNLEDMRPQVERQIEALQPNEEIVVNDYIIRKPLSDNVLTFYEVYDASGRRVAQIADSKFAPNDILEEIPAEPKVKRERPPEDEGKAEPEVGEFFQQEDIMGKVVGYEGGAVSIRDLKGNEILLSGRDGREVKPDENIKRQFEREVEEKKAPEEVEPGAPEGRPDFEFPDFIRFDGKMETFEGEPDMWQFTIDHPRLREGERTTFYIKDNQGRTDLVERANEKAQQYGYEDFRDMIRQAEERVIEEAPEQPEEEARKKPVEENEDWELSREEFARRYDRGPEDQRYLSEEVKEQILDDPDVQPSTGTDTPRESGIKSILEGSPLHRGYVVKQALKEGKPVPEEVLSSYPRLKEKYGIPEAERPGEERPPEERERPAEEREAEEGREAEEAAPEGKKQYKTIDAQNINEDLQAFQVRDKIDQKWVSHLVQNWDQSKLDPVTLWRDTKGEVGEAGDLFVLSGHHRVRAAQQVGAEMPFKEFSGKLGEAKDFAWRANEQAKQITEFERAGLVKREREENELSFKEIAEVLPSIGSEYKARQLYNFAHLDPNGMLAKELENTGFRGIKGFADVVGGLRRKYPELTNSHERQMAEWLYELGGYRKEKQEVKEFFERQIERNMEFGEIQPNLRLQREIMAGDEARTDIGEAVRLKKEKQGQIQEREAMLDRLKERLQEEGLSEQEKKSIRETMQGYRKEIKALQQEVLSLDGEIHEVKRNQFDIFGNNAGFIRLPDFRKHEPLKFENEKAQEVQDRIDQFQREKAEGNRGKGYDPDGIREILTREFVDRSGNIKRELKPFDHGRETIIRKDLQSGSSVRSIDEYQRVAESIFNDLTHEEIDLLGRYRQMRVNVGLAEMERAKAKETETTKQMHLFGQELPRPKEERDIKRPFSEEQAREYMESLQNEYPETFSKIKRASDKMDALFAKKLREARNEGLIGEEAYEEMASRYWYTPTKFVQHYKNYYTDSIMGGKEMKTKQIHLKRYDEGSTEMIVNNPEMLLLEYIKDTNFVIDRNKANRAMMKVADDNPENGFVRRAEVVGGSEKTGKKFESPKAGEESFWVWEQGRPEKMIMEGSLAKEWDVASPSMKQARARTLEWISGNRILKAMATGLNPEFAISNFFRDIAYVWMTTNQYSANLPIAMWQMAVQDLPKVALHAWRKTGPYQDYIREGGGMNFLTHQGRLGEQNPLARGMNERMVDFQNTWGKFGETAESGVRLMLRERAIKNGYSNLEATWIARTYLDFGQGGEFIKNVDHVIPYLNASVQATRGIVRAAKEKPGLFSYKAAQIGGLATGLYYANYKRNPEAWRQVSDREKASNWIITTPIWEKDERGRKRYYYFKIPKDQGQRVISGLFEAGAQRIEEGVFPREKFLQELKDFIPIVPTEAMPPIFSAIVAYAGNRDLWTNDEVWKGREVKPQDEYYRGYTPEAYVKIGEAASKVGLQISPARLQRANEKIFTYNNPFTGLTLGPYKLLQEALDENMQEALNAEVLTQLPFIRRVFERTFPYQDSETERLTREEGSRRKRIDDDFYEMLQGYREGENDTNDIHTFIQGLGRNDRRRYIQKFERWQKMQGVPTWWHRLADIQTPQVRATRFYNRWQKAGEQERREMLRMAHRVPGVWSDKFEQQFNKMQKLQERYQDEQQD